MEWPEGAVFVSEEYGYRYWLWQPEGSTEAVAEAFTATRLQGGLMNGGCLPGVWRELRRPASETWKLGAELDQTDDPERIEALMTEILRQTEEWYDCFDVVENDEVVDTLVVPARRHEAHMHMPADSSLYFVDGPSVEADDDLFDYYFASDDTEEEE